jgi:hypothetical protein
MLYALFFVFNENLSNTMNTILDEQSFNTVKIEIQLVHVDKNSIRGTYNHAQYLEGCSEMMKWHSNYINSLESVKKRHKRSARLRAEIYQFFICTSIAN